MDSSDSDDIYAERFQPRLNASTGGRSTLFEDDSSDEIKNFKPQKRYKKKAINMNSGSDWQDSDSDSGPLPVPKRRPNVNPKF